MNKSLQEFARATLKAGLAKCTNEQQLLLKRLYSNNNLNANIDDVADAMNAGLGYDSGRAIDFKE